MKFWLYRVVFAAIVVFFSKTLLADTWYIRPDGAPHYAPSIASLAWRGLDPNHTCDGKHDAPWPAAGTINALGNVSDGQNQPCALSDYRWLYDDQASYGQLHWIIAGGDTVILDNTQAWRVGTDSANGPNGNEPWCWGWGGGPYGCYNPAIPAGTAQQHTRLLGRNWASCSTANGQPDKAKMTQLFGGHGVDVVLNLAETQYVDVQCLEITRHSQCVLHGNGGPGAPGGCSKMPPIDDFDKNGMWTSQGTHDLLLQDIWDHGHPERGIVGPFSGLITANRVDIDTNGMAGWDFDDGFSTPSLNATLKMSYSTIEWSGCNQEYPAVDPIPVLKCYGQSDEGYGDGLATPSGSGMDVYIDHTSFHHNTQEGLDLLHVDSGAHTLQVTNSASYANNGQQFKWGGNFTSVLFENNIAVGNCLRMSMPIAGVPSVYNSNLGDFCRAFDVLRFNLEQNANVLIANNTVLGYAPLIFDIGCTDASCSNSTLTMRNNLVRGYDNPTTHNMGGQQGGPSAFCGPGCNNTSAPIGNIARDHNLYYGMRVCPANQTLYGSGGTSTLESCADSGFVNEPAVYSDETMFDSYNLALVSGSAAGYAGAPVSGLVADFDGASRSDSPSIGALEVGSQATMDSLFSAATAVVSSPAPAPAPAPAPTPSPGPDPAPTPAPPAGPVATVTTLSVAPVDSLLDDTPYTVTVVPVSGSAAPQGTVTLLFGTYPIATATLDAAGTATWSFPAFFAKLGLNASYGGSDSFLPSSSAVVNADFMVVTQ